MNRVGKKENIRKQDIGLQKRSRTAWEETNYLPFQT